MKILIDNSCLYAGGGVQVALSFLNDLLKLDILNEYHVVQSYAISSLIDEEKFDNRFYFYHLDSKCQRSIIKRSKKVKLIEDSVFPDVIFTTFGPSYHKSNFPKVVGFAIGHIVYPDSLFFNKLSLFALIKIKLLNRIKDCFFYSNSDALIFETDDARVRYDKHISSRLPTFTVSNTLNSIFLDENEWKCYNIEKSDFDILYLTANYLHKNLLIIPKVIDEIISRSPNLHFKFHLSMLREELGFDSKYDQYINYLGHVTVEEVPSLYKKMDALFMPTLLEIFSASYLEAMYMQVPIVASDLSFARDICGKAAIYAEADSAKDYADCILELMSNASLRKELVSLGSDNLKRFGSSIDRTMKYLVILNNCKKNEAN